MKQKMLLILKTMRILLTSQKLSQKLSQNKNIEKSINILFLKRL